MSNLIERQAAIDAIRKDMYADKDYMSAMICDGIESVLRALPSVQPNTTCTTTATTTDCISRQAAFEKLTHTKPQVGGDGTKERFMYLQWIADNEAIRELPSVQERKGRWIYGEKEGQDGWYCSECGGFIPWYYDFYGLDHSDFIKDFLACPFCDTKMDREGAEDDNPC